MSNGTSRTTKAASPTLGQIIEYIPGMSCARSTKKAKALP